MTDKKVLYSFAVTLFFILIIYIAVSADVNTRAMGVGGKLPVYRSFTEEIIHSNDITLYLYRKAPIIYKKLKMISPPELNLILTFGERAIENIKAMGSCQKHAPIALKIF